MKKRNYTVDEFYKIRIKESIEKALQNPELGKVGKKVLTTFLRKSKKLLQIRDIKELISKICDIDTLRPQRYIDGKKFSGKLKNLSGNLLQYYTALLVRFVGDVVLEYYIAGKKIDIAIFVKKNSDIPDGFITCKVQGDADGACHVIGEARVILRDCKKRGKRVVLIYVSPADRMSQNCETIREELEDTFDIISFLGESSKEIDMRNKFSGRTTTNNYKFDKEKMYSFVKSLKKNKRSVKKCVVLFQDREGNQDYIND